MTWLFWQVSESKVKHYIIMMFLILFLLPIIPGIDISLGYVFNFLWADFILYNPYIASQDKLKNKNKKDDDANDTF